MGHNTGYITLSAEEVAGLDDRQILGAGIARWYDEEAERSWDARPGKINRLPICPESYSHDSYDDVWSGESHIVPIAAESDLTRKTARKRVTIDSANSRNAYDRNDAIRAVLGAQVTGFVNIISTERVSKPRKPVVRNTAGRIVTKYAVSQSDFVPRDAKPCDDIATAKQQALELMQKHPEIGSLNIIPVTSRVAVGEDGTQTSTAVLATVTRPETTVTFDVAYEVVTVKPGAKPVEFLAVFDYHS